MTASAVAATFVVGTLLLSLSQPAWGVRKGDSLSSSSSSSSSPPSSANSSFREECEGDEGDDGEGRGGCGNASSSPSQEAAVLASRGTTVRHQATFQNVTRTYWVRVPSTYNATTPLPLLLAFHGWWGSGREFEHVSGFSNASDAHDFIVVYPDGHDDNPNPAPAWMAAATKWRSWNAVGSTKSPGPEGPICYAGGDASFCYDSCASRPGGCDADGCDWTTCVDDLAWIRHLLSRRLARDLRVDEDRVYATGFSNGGMFAYELGAVMSAQLAAVVPFAGSWHPGFLRVPSEGPVPLMDVHGTLDEDVPANETKSYDGWNYVLNDVISEKWARANGCRAASTSEGSGGGGGGGGGGSSGGGGGGSGDWNLGSGGGVFARRYQTKGVSLKRNGSGGGGGGSGGGGGGGVGDGAGDGTELDLWCVTTESESGRDGSGSGSGGGCDYAPVVRCSWRGHHEVPPFGAELAWRFLQRFTRSGLDAAAASAANDDETRRKNNNGGEGRLDGPMFRGIVSGFAIFGAMMMFYVWHVRRRTRALRERIARMERLTALSDRLSVALDEKRAAVGSAGGVVGGGGGGGEGGGEGGAGTGGVSTEMQPMGSGAKTTTTSATRRFESSAGAPLAAVEGGLEVDDGDGDGDGDEGDAAAESEDGDKLRLFVGETS